MSSKASRIRHVASTCGRRRQMSLSFGITALITMAFLVVAAWAESGVVYRDSKIPPPPPPPPRSSGATSQTKVPPTFKGLPEDETATKDDVSRKRLPPPPPPRRMSATSVEEPSIGSQRRQTASQSIPPPPSRRSAKASVVIHRQAPSYGHGEVSEGNQQSEEDNTVSEEDASQSKPSSETLLLSNDAESSFNVEKGVSKEESSLKPEAMSHDDNSRRGLETKHETENQSTPRTAQQEKDDYSFESSTVVSDQKASFQPSQQDFQSRDQWLRKKDLPHGPTSNAASLSNGCTTSTADMVDRRHGPSGQQDLVEQRPEPLQQQAYGSLQYQYTSQRLQPTNAYQRPPSNQYRPPQPQRRPQPRSIESSAVSSTWKSLWGKVEKGLDGLAKVEDSVTGRAQKLFSSVASSSPRRSAASVGNDDINRWNARERSAKVSTPTKTPLTPYGNKFDVAKKQQQQQDSSKSQQTKIDAGLKRPITWNEKSTGKMIRANGGASSPDGQQPLPPSNTSFLSTQAQPSTIPPSGSTAHQNPNAEGQKLQSAIQSSQYVANPYLQSSNLKTPPKELSPIADPHSRSSRIPWDSSTSSSSSMPGYGSSSKQSPRRAATSAKTNHEKEKTPFLSKISRFVPPIPKFASPLKIFRKSSYHYAGMDAWTKDDDEDADGGGFFGFFRRKPKGDLMSQATIRLAVKSGDSLAPPLKSMMERCGDGNKTSLLSVQDKTNCRTIGRYQAFFDGLCVLFVLIGIQQVEGLGNIVLPISKDELISNTIPRVASLLKDAIYTWAPFSLGYAYLALYMKRILLNSRVQNLAYYIGSTVEDESQYAQLYLRLAAAIRMDPSLPANLRQAAASQVRSLVSTARLNAFVTMVLGTLVAMTVTGIGPVFSAIGKAVSQLVTLDEWRSWPMEWKHLGSSIHYILKSLVLSLKSLIARGVATFLENPLQFAFHLSIFVSALLITFIPRIEKGKKINAEKDEDDDVAISSGESAQQFAKLGASSATRLTMLSENGSIESALERWRNSRAASADESSSVSILPTLRRFAYTTMVAIIAALPLVVSYLVGMTSGKGVAHVGLQWNSISDVSVVLVGVFLVASNAIRHVVGHSQNRSTVKSFLSLLSSTLDEIKDTNRRQADIQFMASVSPTAGLVVKDLWAAHTTKRAWAVRGANLQCKNGEILAVLGDDGAGKTRILTTIAESLISPPRRSLTSNKVRGVVAIGGVESSKWDKTILKRRLGVLLSDVRTVADTASLYSGWTMEEILEPIDGFRSLNADHKLSSSEKSSILLALKITGLYTTLIPKLPSKLSTVLTANEEDLRPSALRPRSQVLSPAEWSKLILAKVLAQTIYDNDNAAASIDKVENCMVGSLLLLDDPTVQLSEVEEAKILKDLRQTGAATVLASNKWATGRFADHIVVVRDGAIVESGTHNELISRGPQQSLYAAKWHAMTMQ